MANGPNIFQMLLVSFSNLSFVFCEFCDLLLLVPTLLYVDIVRGFCGPYVAK